MTDGRPALARRLQAAWFDKNLAVFLWPFLPLSWVFGALAALRRMAYGAGWLKQVRLPVPVIVVGNLIVGGAGKTPLVLHLVDALRHAGKHPGIVSRGYGGAGAAGPVAATADPAEVGDEPILLVVRSGVPVYVGRRRADAGRKLLEDHPEIDVLVCDDGLQHYALWRDVEIAVVDSRGVGNSRLLPVGPLREPVSRLDSVDAVVVHAGGALRAHDVFEMSLQPGLFVALNDAGRTISAVALAMAAAAAGKQLHAIAGIGHPERFFETLRSQGLSFSAHPFPDHHPYAGDDLHFAAHGVLLMTEKDAVKCRPFHQGEAWVLPVTAMVSSALTTLVLEKIDGCQTA